MKSGDDCRQEHLAVQLISHFYGRSQWIISLSWLINPCWEYENSHLLLLLPAKVQRNAIFFVLRHLLAFF